VRTAAAAPAAQVREAAVTGAANPTHTVPAGLAAPELARVTDHVLHALDRRALSWHERTGRI